MKKMSIVKLIEKALIQTNPTESLRELAINLNNSGISREKIYEEFYTFYKLLQASNREQDADILGDVMDMITWWYVGRELNLE